MLKSIHELNHSDNYEFEIIIVDNNSNDQTRSVAESYAEKSHRRLQYVFEPRQGLNYARNKGIEKARGDIIVFTDDDVEVQPDWLENIWACFSRRGCDAVGGRVLPVYPEGTPQWVKDCQPFMQGSVLCHDYGEGTMPYDRAAMVPFVGANMSYRRQIFEDYGAFRTDIGAGHGMVGDETEFFRRIEKAGKKIYYCGKALLKHPVFKERMNLRHVAKRNIAYGKYLVAKNNGKIEEGTKCYGRIPRYLIRRMLGNLCRFPVRIVNMPKFVQAWVLVFRDIGMMSQYYIGRKE